jgi:hypothetical protein
MGGGDEKSIGLARDRWVKCCVYSRELNQFFAELTGECIANNRVITVRIEQIIGGDNVQNGSKKHEKEAVLYPKDIVYTPFS